MQIAIPISLITGWRRKMMNLAEAYRADWARRADEDLIRIEAARLYSISGHHLDDGGLSHLAPRRQSPPILPLSPVLDRMARPARSCRRATGG